MAWPTKPNAGDLIEDTLLDAIIDALALWGGNVSAAGYNLSNLGVVTFNAGGYINSDLGVGTSSQIGRVHAAASDTGNSVVSNTAASINITNIDVAAFDRTVSLAFSMGSGVAANRLCGLSGVYKEFDVTNGLGGDMAFWTKKAASSAPTERMRLTADGWLKLNDTGAPGFNPTNGGYMYSESGALKWRGSSGTVTTIAPA